jgi:hypothetical protein
MSCLHAHFAMFKASNDEAVIEAANGRKCVYVEWLLGCDPTLLQPSLLTHVFTHNGVTYPFEVNKTTRVVMEDSVPSAQ